MTPPHPIAHIRVGGDTAVSEAELVRRFPGLCVWYGHATRRCWALVADRAGRCALVEADDPAHLVRRLHRLPGWRLATVPARPALEAVAPDRPAQIWVPAGSRARLRRGPAGWTIDGLVPVQASPW